MIWAQMLDKWSRLSENWSRHSLYRSISQPRNSDIGWYTKLFSHIRVHKIICDSTPNIKTIWQIFIPFDKPELSCKIYFFIYWDWSSYWVVPCWITLSDYFYPYFWILFKYFIKVFHSTISTSEPGTVLWRYRWSDFRQLHWYQLHDLLMF